MPGAFLINDLDGMLRTREFASTAQVMTGEHAGEEITGVLDNPFAEAFSVESNSPVFVAPSWPALSDGDRITLEDSVTGDTRTYRVKLPEPDDTGVTRYPLTEV